MSDKTFEDVGFPSKWMKEKSFMDEIIWFFKDLYHEKVGENNE